MSYTSNSPHKLRILIAKFLENTRLHLLILVLTGVALYIYTLPYPFVFDDRELIMNNPLVRNSAGFWDLFDINDFLPEYLPRLNDPDMVTSFALRPIAYITFRLNFLLGGINPAGYRAVNIAIHIANAVMLYRLLFTIIRLRLDEDSVRHYLAIPFLAALLFLVHPLQTESVTYVTQRFTSLGTFFYIATIVTYLQSLLNKSTLMKRLAYLASIMSLLLGMLTKEFVFTAPFSLLLIEYILLRNTLLNSLRRHIPHLACLALIPAIQLTLSHDLNDLGLTIYNINGFSSLDYGTTQLRVILSYFRLLVLPYNLNFDPDYKLYKSLTNPEIILSILVLLLFIFAAVNLLRRKARDIADDLTAFSIIWFPLLLAVSSSVVPLPDLMSEHRTYLPSLAFSIGMTAYLHSLRQKFSWRLSAGFLAVAFTVLSVFSTQTMLRNQIYSSRLSLWSDTAAKSPNKSRPALALGNIYQEMGQKELASYWLRRAIQLNPVFIEPYLSLGSLYQDFGRDYEAIEVYEAFLESHKPEQRILSNLAHAYSNVGMPVEAIEILKEALKIDPDDEMLHIAMAKILYMADRDSEARQYVADAQELDLANPLADFSDRIRMLRGLYDDSNAPIKGSHVGRVHS